MFKNTYEVEDTIKGALMDYLPNTEPVNESIYNLAFIIFKMQQSIFEDSDKSWEKLYVRKADSVVEFLLDKVTSAIMLEIVRATNSKNLTAYIIDIDDKDLYDAIRQLEYIHVDPFEQIDKILDENGYESVTKSDVSNGKQMANSQTDVQKTIKLKLQFSIKSRD